MVIKKKTALVVDDDADFCLLVKAILEAKGMSVSFCLEIAEAKKYLQMDIPNIIILDMGLKNESGIDFLMDRALNPVWQSIPVVVCSAQNAEATVKDAIRYGADDYLLKPIKQTWLLQRVRKILIAEDELKYEFGNDETVDLIFEAEAGPSEESRLIIKSAVGLEKETTISLNISKNSDEIVENFFQNESKSQFVSDGPFLTSFKNISITESEKKRIQLFKSFWRT